MRMRATIRLRTVVRLDCVSGRSHLPVHPSWQQGLEAHVPGVSLAPSEQWWPVSSALLWAMRSLQKTSLPVRRKHWRLQTLRRLGVPMRRTATFQGIRTGDLFPIPMRRTRSWVSVRAQMACGTRRRENSTRMADR